MRSANGLAWLTAEVQPVPVLPNDVIDHARAEGMLESSWIWVGMTVLALGCAFAVYWFRKRKGKRNLAIVGVVVFALFAGITGVNTYVGYVRTPHDLGMVLARGPAFVSPLGRMIADDTADGADQDDPGSRGVQGLRQAANNTGADGQPRVARIPLADPAVGSGAGMTNVLLPPGYDNPANAGKRYPVVYMIHGYPEGTSDDWFTAGDAVGTMTELWSHHLIPPMILVAPDMSAGIGTTDWECLNVPGGPQLESYLTKFVVPQVDKRFRTIADRGHRAIGGMSGGAFCSLNISLHHLDEFATNLMTLPYDTLDGAESLLHGNSALINANTPRTYLPGMTFTAPLATIIDVGLGAPADVRIADHLSQQLLTKGQRVSVREEPGMNHTWNTARAALPFLIAYAGERFTPGPDRPIAGVVVAPRRFSRPLLPNPPMVNADGVPKGTLHHHGHRGAEHTRGARRPLRSVATAELNPRATNTPQ